MQEEREEEKEKANRSLTDIQVAEIALKNSLLMLSKRTLRTAFAGT